jgi:deoxyribose-phosphate aldolase
MVLIDENYKKLIKKIEIEIDNFGLKPLESAIPETKDRPKAIKIPMDLTPYIEHTLLKPNATIKEVIKLCDEAKRFQFRGVCVNPIFVEEAKKQLKGTNCLVVTVIGFPLGGSLTAIKVEETKQVIELGANEVDMVIALSALKNGEYKAVYQDIKSIVDVAGSIPVKVILESGLLEVNEKIAACLLADRAGAAFVKTATGFSSEGATIEDVRLMRAVVGNKLGIKAAGGIRNFQTARAMIKAGAIRLGCSKSVTIVTESIDVNVHSKEHYRLKTNEIAFKYAWDWFSYHANQRLNAFHFFLIIIGFVVVGYFKSMELEQVYFSFLICLFGALASIAFWFLDIRNEELVNCGRYALDELEEQFGLKIRKCDDQRVCLKKSLDPISCRFPTNWLSIAVAHRFWLRLIMLVTSLSFMFAAFYALNEQLSSIFNFFLDIISRNIH